MESRFRINTPTVTHQVIDGEVIILNLDNGFYYSLADSASIIWQSLNGTPLAEIFATVSGFYEGTSSEIEEQTTAFLKKLETEGLLVPVQDWPHAISLPTVPATKTAFKAPVFEKYTEMSDLLLVDPIHDVDDYGWPRTQEESQEK